MIEREIDRKRNIEREIDIMTQREIDRMRLRERRKIDR